MTHVAKIILFDRNDNLIIYLGDDKPTIPYPNHWDLLSGAVEEEVSLTLDAPKIFGEYVSDEGDIFHIFHTQIDAIPNELILLEGQRLTSIELASRHQHKFGAMLGQAIDDFVLYNATV